MKKALILSALVAIAVLAVFFSVELLKKTSHMSINIPTPLSFNSQIVSQTSLVHIISKVCYTLITTFASIIIAFACSVVLSLVFSPTVPYIIRKIFHFIMMTLVFIPTLVLVILAILFLLPYGKLNIMTLSIISSAIAAIPFAALFFVNISQNISKHLKEEYVLIDRIEGLGTLQIFWKYKKVIFIRPPLSSLCQIFPMILSTVIITNIFLNIPDAGTALLSAVKNSQIRAALLYIVILTFAPAVISQTLKLVTIPSDKDNKNTAQDIYKNFIRDYLFNNKFCLFLIFFLVAFYILCISRQILSIHQDGAQEILDSIFVTLTFIISASYMAAVVSLGIVRISAYENILSKSVSLLLSTLNRIPSIILYFTVAIIFIKYEDAMVRFMLSAFYFGIICAIKTSSIRCESIRALRNKEFIKAAKRYGSSEGYIIKKHLLPLTKSEFAAGLFYNCAEMSVVITMFGIVGIGLEGSTADIGAIIAKGFSGNIPTGNVIAGLVTITAIVIIFSILTKICEKNGIYKRV